MSEAMTRQRFLETLRAERARWEAALARVDRARLEASVAAGGWSVKDIVAHVVWSERELLGLVSQRALVGSPLWQLDQDERNGIVYEQNRLRPVDEVLAEAEEIYARLLAGLEGLEDQDFIDPGRFQGMPAGWVPWRIFSGSTFEHYQAHRPAIEASVEEERPSP